MSVTSIARDGDADAMTRALRGFTEVRGFALTFDVETSTYELRLALANGAGTVKTLVCRDVQNLELNATGEGFEQMPRLRIEDVSADGLGRIRYTVDELETEAIFLHCGEVALTDG